MESVIEEDSLVMETGDSVRVEPRHSCPYHAFRLANEIQKLKICRRTVSEAAIVESMRKMYKTDAHVVKKELQLAIKDGLFLKKSNGCYKINDLLDDIEHDYYCYTCAGSGEVRKCVGCWRVFHITCFAYSDEHGKCFFCKEYQQKPVRKRKPTVPEINDILEILYRNMFRKFPKLYDESLLKIEDPVVRNFASKLVYNFDYNYAAVAKKLERNAYKCIMDFVFECKTIWHNFRCLYGDKSELGKTMNDMYNFVLSEEHAIYNCLDCYAHAAIREKDDTKDWFLIPCNPPHQLGFAKVEGYPPYPAKIMRSTSAASHVWFFDENHEIALVNHVDIFPSISVKFPISEQLSNSLKEFEKHKALVREKLRKETVKTEEKETKAKRTRIA